MFTRLVVVLICFVLGGIAAGAVMAGVDVKMWFAAGRYIAGGEGHGPGSAVEGTIFCLVGDVLPASEVPAKGSDYPWSEAGELLKRADLTIANLACVVSDRGRPEPDREYIFRAAPRSLDGAARAGVDVFTLANDHVLDYGREAMLDTIEHIRKRGMLAAGFGLNEKEALAPAMLEINGNKVAVLAFSRIIPRSSWIAGKETPGIASGHNYELMMNSVRVADREAQVTIVSMHWGEEHRDYPEKRDVELARDLVDAGADIVVGHHPCVVQGIEIYRGRIIAYSLGIFMHNASGRKKGGEGIVLQVAWDGGEGYGASIIPSHFDSGTVRILKGDDGKRVLERVNRLSHPFKTSVGGKGEVRELP